MQEFANCDILHLKKNCRKELNEIFYSQSTLYQIPICALEKNCMVGIWETKPKVAKNDQKLTNGDILHFRKNLNPVERNFRVTLHHTRFLYKQWQLNCKAGI